MLTLADIDAMRNAALASLPDVVSVQRAVIVPDGLGGETETWSTIATVQGRVSPGGLSPNEQRLDAQVQSRTFWTITFPAGTDVTSKDRCVVSGQSFEVVGVAAPRSWELVRRVNCVVLM